MVVDPVKLMVLTGLAFTLTVAGVEVALPPAPVTVTR
jgi:hypothetical protein